MPTTSSAAAAAVLTLALFVSSAGLTQAQGQTQTTRNAAELRADSLYAAHKFREALAAYDDLTRLDSAVSRNWMQLGMSAAQAKEYAAGARAFAHASALGVGPVAAYNAGAMHARLGHVDSAFVWLTRAVATGFYDTTTFNSDDDLASLRHDPRFAKLREAMRHTPSPCVNDSTYHKFDFWVGKWRVTNLAGNQVGISHVDVVSGGCALLENWHDMRDGEGKSLNTFDPATHQWRQFWVGQGGQVTDYRESEWRDGSVSFFVRYPARTGGAETIMRLTFSPLDAGAVRQHSEISSDAGKSWTTQYDFYYHRVP